MNRPLEFKALRLGDYFRFASPADGVTGMGDLHQKLDREHYQSRTADKVRVGSKHAPVVKQASGRKPSQIPEQL